MSMSVAITGRIGKDAERVDTKSGKPMATASVAVNVEREVEGEQKPQPLWVKLIGFGRQADDVACLKRGDPVRVMGRMQTSRYNDRQGNERQAWECIVDALHSARRPDRGDGEQPRQGNGDASP